MEDEENGWDDTCIYIRTRWWNMRIMAGTLPVNINTRWWKMIMTGKLSASQGL